MDSGASSPSSANTQAAHRPSGNANGNSNASNQANINGMVRYAQLRDMSNHQTCKEHNQQALLAEKMAKLGALVKEIEETDWMFDINKRKDEMRPIGLNKGVEERW